VAAALALAYLVVDPTGADLPAQLYRARLFSIDGFGIWSNWWYGGQDLPAYSVLFPPLAALTSPQLVAALASVATAAAFEALVHDIAGDAALIGATWLGAATVTELLSGRLTFALGLCGVALTVLMLERRRARAATALALLSALASPVAALFAALAGATAIVAGPGRRGAGGAVILASLVPVLALAVAFPEGGSQPFAFATLWPLIAVGAAVAVAAQRGGDRTIPVAIVLYLAGCVLAYAIPSPAGGNVARLGELVAGPLAALVLVPRRAWAWLGLAALPLLYLQAHDAVSDLQKGWRSPYDTASYYRPLIAFLQDRPGGRARDWRVEVPLTAGHWDAYRLALAVPLARGWERQLDIADDHLFYGGRLNARTYRGWLDQLAVRYVALPDAPIDHSSRSEVRLIRSGLGYLHVVAALPHWTVYEVKDATPLATGAARVTEMDASALTLDVTRPGRALVRVRFSPYWRLSGVRGCVAPAGALTELRFYTRGRARLAISFSLSRVASRSPRCD
jgi:hypothetical protein